MYKDPSRMNEYQKNWVQARKAAFLLGKKCTRRKCKSTEGLGLSMKDPKKNPRSQRTPWSLSEEKFAVEIKKYRIYCKTHLKEQWIKNMKKAHPKVVTHGVYNSYAKKGCRCAPCKEAYSSVRHQMYLRSKLMSI